MAEQEMAESEVQDFEKTEFLRNKHRLSPEFPSFHW